MSHRRAVKGFRTAALLLVAAGPLAALAASPVASPAATFATQPARDCATLATFDLSAANVMLTSARAVPAGPAPMRGGPPGAAPLMLPAHCLVDGEIDRRTGVGGKPYAIGFSVALPTEWNGRFLFQGGGGLNGSVNPPLGAQAAGDQPALARGFAVVSMDSGHKASGFDASFLGDQEATLNFLYQAIGKVTPVAKRIVTQYYGSAPRRSYFVGCSTGGREGMITTQRYPNEFDGVVSGAPAMRTNYSNLSVRWVTASLNAVAPKDASGNAITNQALSPADRQTVIDGLLKACDGLDGAKDGLVFATRACRFDPKTLVCKGAKRDGCLSAPQADAIARAFGGPHTRAGIAPYPGFPYDTGIAATGAGIPGLLFGGTNPEGASPKGAEMDVDAEAAAAHDGRSMAGDTNAWLNLSSFNGHGGKLIFFHGVSDPWFSAFDTVQYYEKLASANAPLVTADWSRLFLVPGMGHCGGGQSLDRFDLLGALVSWVEEGQAPASAVATGAAFPGRSRPLCPYPQHATYSGSGDPEQAANYRCGD